MQAKAQLAHQSLVDSRNLESSQWPAAGNNVHGVTNFPSYPSYMNPISPQSSLDSIDHNSDIAMNMQEIQSSGSEFSYQACSKKRPYNGDLGELQALALRMMRN